MIYRLLVPFYLSKAIRHSRNGELDQSLSCLSKIEKENKLSYISKALRANILLRKHDIESALSMFDEVVKITSTGTSAKEKYVNLYAKSIINAVRGQKELSEIQKREAARISANSSIRRWLPL